MHPWWQKAAVYLMFLGSGVAIDVTASDDVTQNSCLERSQFGIVYRSAGQLCPTLGAPAGAGLDPEKGREFRCSVSCNSRCCMPTILVQTNINNPEKKR